MGEADRWEPCAVTQLKVDCWKSRANGFPSKLDCTVKKLETSTSDESWCLWLIGAEKRLCWHWQLQFCCRSGALRSDISSNFLLQHSALLELACWHNSGKFSQNFNTFSGVFYLWTVDIAFCKITWFCWNCSQSQAFKASFTFASLKASKDL